MMLLTIPHVVEGELDSPLLDDDICRVGGGEDIIDEGDDRVVDMTWPPEDGEDIEPATDLHKKTTITDNFSLNSTYQHVSGMHLTIYM